MKKFVTSLIFLFLFVSSINFVFAQSSSSSATLNDVKKYNLAYPGILPDHPLYKLKVLRDKITLLMISDPNKKIDYYLLLSDKGIAATNILVNNNKTELAKETALKGENNYTLLTYAIKANKWKVSKEQYKKVEIAALKHQEVLKEIIKKVSQNDKKTFDTVLYFSSKNLKEVKDTQKTLN